MDSFVTIAHTNLRNQNRPFGANQTIGIKPSDRRLHAYLLGKTGTGKSTLLKNLIIQDIRNGHGLAVVDPHGDLVRDLLRYVPSPRTGEVIYFNPADQEYPIGLNLLEAVEPSVRPLVASQALSVFKHVWADSWGPRLEYILANSLLTLLEVPGSTLLVIPRLLTDKAFRSRVVACLTDPVVKRFWLSEYERYSPTFQQEAIAPIQNKVGQFLASSLMRNVVAQPRNKMDLSLLMDKGRILLADLAKGKIGEEATMLVGSLLVTKLFLAALTRVDQPEQERKDFYLYLDECQNITTPILASILSEARKYRLNLILSHQYVAQLPEAITQAILGNVGTLICFRLGAQDAQALEQEFAPEVSAQELERLGPYEICLRLAVDGVSTRPLYARTFELPAPDPKENNAATIRKTSQQRYGVKREVIEEKITRWLGGNTSSPVKKAQKHP